MMSTGGGKERAPQLPRPQQRHQVLAGHGPRLSSSEAVHPPRLHNRVQWRLFAPALTTLTGRSCQRKPLPHSPVEDVASRDARGGLGRGGLSCVTPLPYRSEPSPPRRRPLLQPAAASPLRQPLWCTALHLLPPRL
jgi:hypothetical protein